MKPPEDFNVEVTVMNWLEYQKFRKDVEHPSWFKLDNRIYRSESLFEISDTEFKAFICILCICSQRKNETISFVSSWFCWETGVSFSVLKQTLEKLSKDQTLTYTLRPRNVPGGLTPPENRENRERDSESASPSAPFDFEILYERFPKRPKEDNRKSAGISKLRKKIKTRSEFERITQAVINYAAHCIAKNEKYPIKWPNWIEKDWEDWVDRTPATSSSDSILDIKIIDNDPEVRF